MRSARPATRPLTRPRAGPAPGAAACRGVTRSAALLCVPLGGLLLVAAPSARLDAGRTVALVRVDQLGYAPGERKVAYLLAPRASPRAPFMVVDGRGRVVLRGRAGPSRGRWNARWGAVQPLDLSALH